MAKCCDGRGPVLVAPTSVDVLGKTRTLFDQAFWPTLQAAFPDLAPQMACGLVGNGSECLGYDDELSRDHDWGVDFFVWLPEGARGRVAEVEAARQSLIAAVPAELRRKPSQFGSAPCTMTVGDFYRGLVGYEEGPQTLMQWRSVPESLLAMATSGEVFVDGAGEFSVVRERLLAYYPEDLRLKKMAARCMEIAQTGQYNLSRMVRRGDWVCMRDILVRFSNASMGLAYLMARTYQPYYKWAWRRLRDLGDMTEVANKLRTLAMVEGLEHESLARRQRLVDDLCSTLGRLLREREGLTGGPDAFFTTYAEQLTGRINDPTLRGLPLQYE